MKFSSGRRKRLWVLTASVFVLTVIALLAGGFFYAGHIVAVERIPQRADVGVVLAGNFARAMYTADLYQQGLVSRIWITRPEREGALAQLDSLGVPYPRQEDVSRAVLIKKGVPGDRIEIIGEGVLSTIGEAKLIAGILKAKPEYRSLLIITSPPHIRRAEAIFRYVLGGSPSVAVSVIGTPYDKFVADQWWKDRDSARQVVLETAKLLLFWAGTEF